MVLHEAHLFQCVLVLPWSSSLITAKLSEGRLLSLHDNTIIGI